MMLVLFLAPITRVLSKKGTFSRAYSRFDSATAFRAQLLTRSVTQDSDNTVIDEDHYENEDSTDGKVLTFPSSFSPTLDGLHESMLE